MDDDTNFVFCYLDLMLHLLVYLIHTRHYERGGGTFRVIKITYLDLTWAWTWMNWIRFHLGLGPNKCKFLHISWVHFTSLQFQNCILWLYHYAFKLIPSNPTTPYLTMLTIYALYWVYWSCDWWIFCVSCLEYQVS